MSERLQVEPIERDGAPDRPAGPVEHCSVAMERLSGGDAPFGANSEEAMKKLDGFWSTSAIALAVAAPVDAAQLVTPNVSVTGGDTVICRIVNTGSAPLEVTLEILDGAGGAVSGPEEVTVPAGGMQGLSLDGNAGAGNNHCRFAGAFGKSRVRASIDVVSAGHTIAVAPAQ
jgi:hypothetical protein